jgi:hypothetical protein
MESSSTIGASIGAPPASKLARENFLSWEAQIMPTLCGARVMRPLEVSDPAPPEFVDAEDADKKKIHVPNPAYNMWISRDQQVVSYIVNSISEDILSHVYGMVHAAEVWSAIHELFSSQSKSRVSNIRGALTNTNKLDMTAQEYITKMKGFASELATIGKTVDDDELKDYIMNGLDGSYNVFVAALKVVPSTSLNDMCSQLLSYETRDTMLSTTGPASGSFMSSVNAASRVPNHAYGGGPLRTAALVPYMPPPAPAPYMPPHHFQHYQPGPPQYMQYPPAPYMPLFQQYAPPSYMQPYMPSP